MLDEIAVRKIKSSLISEIEHLNIEISKKRKEIEDDKKRILINQAKLGEIDEILEDGAA